MRKIARALISVSDKQGVVEFARVLSEQSVELISTGGTASVLREAGLVVIDISSYTGFPEMLDGRVKTLHPKVHGGILAQRANSAHCQALASHEIGFIDLVVVNLYPFRQTVAREDVTLVEAIENIDIGGPAMIRSAAKNYQDVAVVVDPADYPAIISELTGQGGLLNETTRAKLAAKAFAHTAQYDLAIAGYFSTVNGELAASLGSLTDETPSQLVLALERRQGLRYGENPHQSAALYLDTLRPETGVATARQLQGKELSFNNLLDADAAWALVNEFDDTAETACVIVKHTNPCGVALGETTAQAFERARATDPVSAFGGILAFNATVDEAAAAAIKELFLELIIAPDFTDSALTLLATKKNLRLITLKKKSDLKLATATYKEFEIKKISGGFLVQGRDSLAADRGAMRVVSARTPTENEWGALDFAWKICKHVKSNAIVYARAKELLGVGAGQMSRVDSVKLAATKAVLPLTGSVMASDAFFPFRDGIDEAVKHGITAVVQPGGSMRDAEVIQAADEHGLAMVFTGIRHFKH